jgi:hypothetical protein
MILLEKHTGLAVNPDDVSSMGISSSNGYAVLGVRMKDGKEHRIKHTAGCWDGDDIYVLHKQLLEAQ